MSVDIRVLSGSFEDVMDTSTMLELGDGRYSALGIGPTVLGSGL